MMPTLLFVHGTGVREVVYNQAFDQISEALRPSGMTLARCFWGAALGSRVPQKSIPSMARRAENELLDEAEAEIQLWGFLYEDPLYELRVLALRTGNSTDGMPGHISLRDEFEQPVLDFSPSQDLLANLADGGISQIVFDDARTEVHKTPSYQQLLDTNVNDTIEVDEYRSAIARSIIAVAMAELEDREPMPPILLDAILRDNTIDVLIGELAGARGIGSRVTSAVFDALATVATPLIKWKRDWLSDRSSGFVGDVLLYQGRGEEIRAFIKKAIEEATPPVVLLGHSLGGIACVDLLVAEKLPVELLITVGSQAPYLYEMDALQCLRYDKSLPPKPDFPRWLNIYDVRDFLSYVAAPVFGEDRVEDVAVDNRQPFPRSHSAYWANKEVWEAVGNRMAV